MYNCHSPLDFTTFKFAFIMSAIYVHKKYKYILIKSHIKMAKYLLDMETLAVH